MVDFCSWEMGMRDWLEILLGGLKDGRATRVLEGVTRRRGGGGDADSGLARSCWRGMVKRRIEL